MKSFRLVAFLFLLGLIPGITLAETCYVADQLVITLREGMGTQYRVVQTLKTDTPMTIIREDGNYLFVRLEDGTEGYVLKQYVSRHLPKPVQIRQLQSDVEALQQQLEQQKGAVEQLQQTRQTLQETAETLAARQQELDELKKLSDNVLMVEQERQRLKDDLAAAAQELEVLRGENTTMLRTAMIKWFLAGAGVLFFGWMLGKFSQKKRRSSFGSY
ncbi:MAG: TIGR04211 family SH3 domain-containing protein [Desulfuromonadaceae bacterium]|nr:TIGR04211 family SH3 domain-containing protein [Desulfuromonadaceae bacterium]